MSPRIISAQPRPRWNEEGHVQENEKPLSSKIDPWIWTSMVLSLASLCALWLSEVDMKSKNRGATLLLPVRYGIWVVVVFYDVTLLVLSSKDRSRSIARTRRGNVGAGYQNSKDRKEKMEADVEVEVVDTVVEESRYTPKFWTLAVCQSGVVVIGLFVAMRSIQIFGSWGCGGRVGGDPVVGCFELAFGLGQMALMACIAICCVICETPGSNE